MNRATAAAALVAAPIAVLAGCNSSQNSGPTATSTSTTTTSTAAAGGQTMKAELKSADGRPVANATIDFSHGYATVTVETVGGGILTPGSHGMHIHSVGKCEPHSVGPNGGPPGDFDSAGGHLQAPGHTAEPASGDLTPLNVRADGSGKVVATTDALTVDDLKGPDGSALIIHQGPDNIANIPQRYSHGGIPGPDAETMATGDAGPRVACAVLSAPSPLNGTSTVTETSVAPGPPVQQTSPAEPGPSTTATPTPSMMPPTMTPPINPMPGARLPGR